MESYTLKRTGDRPLNFTAEKLAEASTQQHQGPCENRYWELELYRTEGGQYVISVGYRTRWQGEHDTDTAIKVAAADGLVAALDEYDWVSRIYGYPRGHDDKQAELLRRLGDCWDQAVGELLAGVEPEKI